MTLTADEIRSQPGLWRRVAAGPVPEYLAARGRRMLVIGCGTSAFMAMSYAELRERAGFGETDWAFASEVPAGRRYDTVLALTRSGTTTEIVDAVRELDADTQGGPHRGPGWTARAAGRPHLALDFADEASIVQTRFPTTAMSLLRAGLGTDLEPAIADSEVAVEDRCRSIRPTSSTSSSSAPAWTVGLAHEAALKMRESAQAWSESYPAMDYRHGPIAVAGARSLVWMFGTPPPGLVDQVDGHRRPRGHQRPGPAGPAGPGAAAGGRGRRGARAGPRPSACPHPVGGAR